MTVSLFDSLLQLSKRTFCKILSNCRSERDVETGEIGQNQDITSDSEDLTAIWSTRRSVRPPRAHGRFPLNIRNLSWTFGCKFVIIPGQPQPLLYCNDFHCMIPTNSGARFSKVPKLFGRISGEIILFVSSKQRPLEAQDFKVIFIFIRFTKYEKTSFTE